MFSDLKFALHALLKNPGFAAIVVLTLALGIGATTAIFSVVHATLLRPLPYPNAERLVSVMQVNANGNRMWFSSLNFEDIRDQSGSFAALATWFSVVSC